MPGLLKAYADFDMEESIDSKYVNRPDRLGMTLCFGDAGWLPEVLDGTTIDIDLSWVVEGPQNAFVLADLPERFPLASGDLFISRQIRDGGFYRHPYHLTLGWVEGSAPINSCAEAQEFIDMINSIEETVDFINRCGFKAYRRCGHLAATIEWLDFTKKAIE